MNRRDELLLRMYDQMFNDIDRHVLVVWQSVGVLVGAFAILALTEKEVITVDVAASLIILIACWSLTHLYDAAYWYNRNLVIIANIERQFLTQSDLKDIHYYFGKHRPDNKMITHLRIQFALALGLGLIVLVFHFDQRVVPGFGSPFGRFEFQRAMPYLVALAGLVFLAWTRRQRIESYKEFMENSPGIDVDTGAISYGVGHGHPKPQQ